MVLATIDKARLGADVSSVAGVDASQSALSGGCDTVADPRRDPAAGTAGVD
jgi:hypothetical protein